MLASVSVNSQLVWATSQAAVARLEAGGVGATLTTLQKVATALGLKVTVDLIAVR